MDLVKYTRDQHSVSRKNLSSATIKVLYRLHEAGYQAFVVGGCVRDLLRGHKPKDFDVATDATPDQVNALFRNCRLIGRRFRLAHIHFGREIIEVATFRSDEKGEADDNGQVLNQNSYGTIESDTLRRDFSVNALYYNIADFSIHDYVGAMEDVEEGMIRMIGDPDERYQEDPVRMLRAIRFAAKLGMRIEPNTEQGIARQKHLLENIPQARLFDETLKLFLSGHAADSYEELRIHDLFGELYPETDAIFKDFDSENAIQSKRLLKRTFKNTDQRIKHDKPIAVGFLYAAIYWPVFRHLNSEMLASGIHWHQAINDASDQVFQQAATRLGLPMRHKSMARDIWAMQTRLTSPMTPGRIKALLINKRFRAGFDFLELRLQSGEDLQAYHELWVQAQLDMPEAIANTTKKRRRRK